LEHFRKLQNLGAGGVLDERTEIAVVQRALEELAQESLFAKPGVRDLRTDEALRRFKASHGLEADATLDTATRKRSPMRWNDGRQCSLAPVSELEVIERAPPRWACTVPRS
jgi:Putative peptidoglycan binding domain